MNLKSVIRMSIESITVHHTESSYLNDSLGKTNCFNIEKTYTDLPMLENEFALAGSQVPIDAGSDKTQITINFINGEKIPARMDLNKRDCELMDFIQEGLTRKKADIPYPY